MKIQTANASLNILGGILLGITGAVAWGYAAWAGVTPLPEQPAIEVQSIPDQAACRAHASDLGFRRFVARPQGPEPAKGYPAPATSLHFTTDQVPESEAEAEALLDRASSLVTRCAMKLEYFCMGEVCEQKEGVFMRISLEPGAPLKEQAVTGSKSPAK